MIKSSEESLANRERYPWYEIVEGDDLEQGDVFEACPVFAITLPSTIKDFRAADYEAHFRALERDVIVMTQSCDLIKDHPKVMEVLLCQIWKLDELSKDYEYVRQTKGREEIRQGKHPDYHMLNASNLSGFERPYWCQNAMILTSKRWQYLKVMQKELEGLRPDLLADLKVLS
jgi:hypothetical protein